MLDFEQAKPIILRKMTFVFIKVVKFASPVKLAQKRAFRKHTKNLFWNEFFVRRHILNQSLLSNGHFEICRHPAWGGCMGGLASPRPIIEVT